MLEYDPVRCMECFEIKVGKSIKMDSSMVASVVPFNTRLYLIATTINSRKNKFFYLKAVVSGRANRKNHFINKFPYTSLVVATLVLQTQFPHSYVFGIWMCVFGLKKKAKLFGFFEQQFQFKQLSAFFLAI